MITAEGNESTTIAIDGHDLVMDFDELTPAGTPIDWMRVDITE